MPTGSHNRGTKLEKGNATERLLLPLRDMGCQVNVVDFTSGYTGIALSAQGIAGAVGLRREGNTRKE